MFDAFPFLKQWREEQTLLMKLTATGIVPDFNEIPF